MWLCCYGVSFHVWCPVFFEFIMAPVGVYMCSDDNTRNHTNMDITRILLRTKYSSVLNETFDMHINGYVFRIKVVKDSHGPLRINLPEQP